MASIRKIEIDTMKSILDDLVHVGKLPELSTKEGYFKSNTPLEYLAKDYFLLENNSEVSLESILSKFRASNFLTCYPNESCTPKMGLESSIPDILNLAIGHSEYCKSTTGNSLYVLNTIQDGELYIDIYVYPKIKN